LAIAFALMVGTLTGALIYQQRVQKQTTAIVEAGTAVPEAASEDQALSGAGGSIPDSQASPLVENEADGARRETHTNARVTETTRSAPLPSQSSKAEPAEEDLQNPAIYQGSEKEWRRAERMEERRSRRAAQREVMREGRGRKNRSSDDLLRIRDIFEGSRRP
jgi:hypothetical protein